MTNLLLAVKEIMRYEYCLIFIIIIITNLLNTVETMYWHCLKEDVLKKGVNSEIMADNNI